MFVSLPVMHTALRMTAAGQSIDSCKLPLYLDFSGSASHSVLIMKEMLHIPRTPLSIDSCRSQLKNRKKNKYIQNYQSFCSFVVA